MDIPSPAILLIWYVVFVFSTTFHEAAHATLAYFGGDRTAYEGGQVSLDPIPHIRREPVGMVVVPILSLIFLGWTLGYASAPFNPRWAERHPTKYALMSAAGPFANLILAAVAFCGIWALVAAGQLQLGSLAAGFEYIAVDATGRVNGPMAMLAQLLSVTLLLNVLLGLFNLLPLPPLDGAAVVEGLFPHSAGRFYQQMRSSVGLGLLGLFIAWKVFPYIAGPVVRFTIFGLHSLV